MDLKTPSTTTPTMLILDGEKNESCKLDDTFSTKGDLMDNIETFKRNISDFCVNKLKPSTAETITWLGIVILHCALIPTLIAVMTGLTDKLPQVDLVLFIWAALIMFFIRAAILKDIINVITIGFGFMINAVLMALIFFK